MTTSIDRPPRRVVLSCAGCGEEWEPPDPLDKADQARAMAEGCRICGDWLLVFELDDIGGGDRR